MMLLPSYLFRVSMTTTLLVFLLFLGLELFVFLMVELIDLTEGYGIRQAFLYVMATLPSRIYFSIPIILLLGSLLGLARLAVTSELVVMLTSGFSKLQIFRVVISTTAILLFFSVGLGEWLGPMGERFGYEYKSATFKSRSFQPLHGVWLKSNHDFLYIAMLSEDKKEATYVARFQFDHDHRLKAAGMARKAILGEHEWKVKGVRTTFFEKKGGSYLSSVDAETWPVSVNLKVLNNRGSMAYQDSLWNLYFSIQERKGQGLNTVQDEFAFWRRILHPFATFIMVGIGIPFVFGSLRERGIGSKVIMGALVALLFYAVNIFFGPVAAILDLSPMVSAASPSLVVVLASIIYLIITRQKKV